MLMLKIISAIAAFLFGLWAYRAEAKDQGKSGFSTSTRVKIAGSLVSLMLTVVLVVSDANRPTPPTVIPNAISPVLERPIESLAFRYGVSYSLKNPLLKPLATKIHSYIKMHPDSLANLDNDETETKTESKLYVIPYSLIKDSPVWHLARGQDIIVNFFSRGSTVDSIRRTDYKWLDDAGQERTDKTPKGETEVRFPLFDYTHPEQYGFGYDAEAEELHLVRVDRKSTRLNSSH